jgi:hypothetical protein
MYRPIYADVWEDDERAPYKSLPQVSSRTAWSSTDDDVDGVVKYITQYWQEEHNRIYKIDLATLRLQRIMKQQRDELYDFDQLSSQSSLSLDDNRPSDDATDEVVSSETEDCASSSAAVAASSATAAIEPEQDNLYMMAVGSKFLYT